MEIKCYLQVENEIVYQIELMPFEHVFSVEGTNVHKAATCIQIEDLSSLTAFL